MTRVKTSNLTRVATSVAVDKTAARVMQRGVHWEPRKERIKPWDAWQETPLPVYPTPKNSESLVGWRVGRYTVIGYAKSGGRWVVRYACGMYGHVRARFLRSHRAKTEAMCPKCNYLEEMKKKYYRKDVQ